MDNLSLNPLFEFNPNQLQEVRKLFGYEDVTKMNQELDMLQDWIQKQNHFKVKDFDRGFLERYLIFNKGSVERTKKKLDKLCTLRHLMPEFLLNRKTSEFEPLITVINQCVVPKPTKDNYRIFISRIVDSEKDIGDIVLTYFRYMIIICEYFLCHDYIAGCELIIDLRVFSSSLLAKVNPMVLQKGVNLVVETLGFRLKALHLISASNFLTAVVFIVKQAMSEKLKKRLQVHNTLESLYEFIDVKLLPKDYGGEGRTIKELTDVMFATMSSDEHKARLKYMEKVVTDESRRLSTTFNEEYSGMPGSFKRLCVD